MARILKVLVVTMAMVGCTAPSPTYEPYDIDQVTLSDDSSLVVGSPTNEYRLSWEETDDSVTIDLRVSLDPDATAEAGLEVGIELSDPLGDRVVIDAFDGEPIPVD